jgi:transposase
MLYLGIDQHARQITISLRDDHGDVVQARQVSTEPKKINAFFQQLTRERLRSGEPFVAVLEVCGFNDWLIRMLRDYRCHKVILIQPDDRKKCKTDRRDAAALSELLWVNRDRLLHGKPVRGLRQVDIASTTDQENRRLTTLRKEAGQARARLINKIRHMLRRHNLQWELPTKRLPTLSAIAWLKQVVLPEIDRLEMKQLLADLEHVQQHRKELEAMIAQRSAASKEAAIIATMPGVKPFYRHVIGLPCRPCRALSASTQPGQLLGAHAWLPQQRRKQSTPWKHHQGWQRHGQMATGSVDA